MRTGIASGLVLLVLSLWADPVRGSGRLLVTVSEVTATTAVLWVRSERDAEVVVELTATRSASPPPAILMTSAERDHTGKTIVRGLEPATGYRYRVRAGSESIDGRFVTAPADREALPVVFVWSGDLGGGRQCRRAGSGYPIFRAMAERRPEFFLFVGDTVYADRRCTGPDGAPGADFKARSLADFHRKHRYNRADPAVHEFLRETSVYAIWDDHDVRNNFAGTTEPLAPTGLRAFLDYWPVTPPDEDPTRLYRRVRWGRLVDIFILDTRQYRRAGCLDGSSKTMLGDVQRKWLIDGMATSEAVWKLVVSTVPFSIAKGGVCGDSWAPRRFLWFKTGFATERKMLLDAWREQRVENVIVLAADVHYAELLRHRPAPALSFHEFIAGPLAATPKDPGQSDARLGSERLFARGGLNTFGEISIDQTALTVRIIDEQGRILVTRTIEAQRSRPGRLTP
jgi:alkaline phosphatase D